MYLGCGRIFEGTAKQMFESLNKLKNLPDETVIYSGHEYAKQNAKFALTVDPTNSDLVCRVENIMKNANSNIPNVGASLKGEKKTNPFLRTGENEVKLALGLENSSELEVFTTLREMKDAF